MTLDSLAPDITLHGLAEVLRKAADQLESMSSLQAAHSMVVKDQLAHGRHDVLMNRKGKS
jgi:hypothetical protein